MKIPSCVDMVYVVVKQKGLQSKTCAAKEGASLEGTHESEEDKSVSSKESDLKKCKNKCIGEVNSNI